MRANKASQLPVEPAVSRMAEGKEVGQSACLWFSLRFLAKMGSMAAKEL